VTAATVEQRLYELMPAVYRARDATRGEPLRALLAVLESELDLLEADVERLYDNWFVETCDPWVLPYLGDLLGVRGLVAVDGTQLSQRGVVANTLAYRRAKGTAAVLEQLARDVTGWNAKAVEFFERLIVTQNVNHVRLDNRATLDLRDADGLELAGGPFERAAHTAEVRHVDSGRGRYNIPAVGIFVWRLTPYRLERVGAHAVVDPPDGRYTFDPLGASGPLFNVPRTETELSQLAGELNVAGRLRRRPPRAELAERRAAFDEDPDTEEAVSRDGWFDSREPIVRVWEDGVEIPPRELAICDLSTPAQPIPEGWRRPQPTPAPAPQDRPIAVDPVTGRLAWPSGQSPNGRVEVSYTTGFAGDLGAGPYHRTAQLELLVPDPGAVTFQRGVRIQPDPDARVVDTLQAALDDWNAEPPGSVGLIAVMDSGTYAEDLTVSIPEGSRLTIVASEWNELPDDDAVTGKSRFPGRGLQLEKLRPHLRGDVSVRGDAPAGSARPGQLAVDGLLIEGPVDVLEGNLGRLALSATTLVPASGGLTVATAAPGQPGTNDALRISLARAISGPIALPDTVAELSAIDSIVDGGGGPAIAATAVRLERCTVLGSMNARSLEASNCILSGSVVVSRRQTGCVRFSYVSRDSLVPRRFHCVPASAEDAARIEPAFEATAYGEPSYCQLAAYGPLEIATGADDEGELGAFNFLKQQQRTASLRARLDEYLRFGLEAGVFFVT
jgi:hypothetical protein